MCAATDVRKGAHKVHLRQTQAFIEADPLDLVLRRPALVPDGVGGKVQDAESETYPQHCRVVGVRDPIIVITSDGRQVTVTKQLVGIDSFDVQIGDFFDHDGVQYEVMTVSDQPHWRKIAGAMQLDQ